MDITPPRTTTPRQPAYRSPGLRVGVRGNVKAAVPSATHSPFLAETAAAKPKVVQAAAVHHQAYAAPVVKKPEIITIKPKVATSTTARRHGRRALRAHMLHKAVQQQPKATKKPRVAKKQRTKKAFLPRLGYGFAGIIFLLGMGIALQGLLLNQNVDTQVHAVAAKAETSDAPIVASNEKPKDKNFVANHTVAPLAPRTITIPSINVNARVLALSIDKEGAMQAPKTAYDTGWYSASSRPGEMGAMVIDGHVMGDGNAPGIFSKLKTLSAGSKIVVERGDKKQFTYTVKKVETLKTTEVNMGKLLVSSDTSKPGLTLITCGGTMDRKNLTFDSRTIIHAVQE